MQSSAAREEESSIRVLIFNRLFHISTFSPEFEIHLRQEWDDWPIGRWQPRCCLAESEAAKLFFMFWWLWCKIFERGKWMKKKNPRRFLLQSILGKGNSWAFRQWPSFSWGKFLFWVTEIRSIYWSSSSSYLSTDCLSPPPWLFVRPFSFLLSLSLFFLLISVLEQSYVQISE